MAGWLQGKEKGGRELRILTEVMDHIVQANRGGCNDRRGLVDWDKIWKGKESEMLAKPDNWFS